MAETTNRVLLKVDFEGSSAIKAAADLRKALEGLQSERKKLLDKVAEGNALSEKERVQLELLNAQIKENKRETGTITKFIDDSIKARKAETGSIEANRAKLSQLTAEYIKSANPTKKMTDDIKKLSDTLKQQEGAIGDNRRNVGGYREALAGLGGPIGASINGIQGFNTALKANPIVAVVGLIQSLIQSLGKNAKIADTVSFAFSALNKGFHFIIDTIVNTVSSFAKLKEAVTSPVKFIKDLFNGVVEAGKAGFDSAKQMDELTESSAKLNSQIKLNEIQIRSLTFQLKDRTKSEQDRIKIANQIAALEIANADKQLEKSKQLLEAKQLELKDLELKGEQKAELLDLESAVIEAESEKQIAQSQKQTRINVLLQKDEAQAMKDGTDAYKEQLALRQKARQDFESINKAFREEIKKVEEENKKEQEKATDDNFKKQSNQIDAEEDLRKQQADVRQQLADAEVELEKSKFSAIQGLIDLAQAAAGENASLQAVLFGLEKAVAISEIIVNLQRERGLNAVAAANLNAILPGSGVVYLATQNTLAAVRAGTGIAAITAQAIPQIQKLEEGGGVKAVNIDGKSHSQGGEDVVVGGRRVANIEGGENMYILRKTASHYINKLSGLNQAFGGKSFGAPASSFLASGGLVSDGGFTQRSIAAQVDAQLSNSQLERAFRNMPQPVVRVTDIQRVSSQLNNSVNVSEL